ncbi:LuxR C-terminal-related transcriptional regulator [Streptomyces sp. NPDC050636]|uniref:helix-turn-helix transcriptional regulator n=1 Tax=Streptomyces sp. NPDC050636 TaxID=3154510 RepID=UPI0034391995
MGQSPHGRRKPAGSWTAQLQPARPRHLGRSSHPAGVGAGTHRACPRPHGSGRGAARSRSDRSIPCQSAASFDLADASGARPLAERAHRALLATGARPRRKRQSGISALIARERRIATLVVEGMANHQIAASLFISRRTVEFHLTRVYRKLGVDGRADLVGAMTGSRS